MLQWGLANDADLRALCFTNAVNASQAANKFISHTWHGGRRTDFSYPQSASGQGLSMELTISLAQKALWVIDNYTGDQIDNYLATYPSDTSMAVYWFADQIGNN
jgi:hypothetical protein